MIEVSFLLIHSLINKRGALFHAVFRGLRLVEDLPFHPCFIRLSWALPCRSERTERSCLRHKHTVLSPYSVSQNSDTWPQLTTKETLGPRKIEWAWRWLDSVWTYPINSRDFQTGLNKNINKISVLFMRHLNKKCDTESFKIHGWLKTYQKHTPKESKVSIILTFDKKYQGSWH